MNILRCLVALILISFVPIDLHASPKSGGECFMAVTASCLTKKGEPLTFYGFTQAPMKDCSEEDAHRAFRAKLSADRRLMKLCVEELSGPSHLLGKRATVEEAAAITFVAFDRCVEERGALCALAKGF